MGKSAGIIAFVVVLGFFGMLIYQGWNSSPDQAQPTPYEPVTTYQK